MTPLVKTDRNGNSITVKNGKVHLNIFGQTRGRTIGQISDGKLVVYRDIDKHLFKKTNSYGFCYDLLKSFKIKSVYLEEEMNGKRDIYGPYDPSLFLDNGEFMYFKEEGFERQIFIPRKYIIENSWPQGRSQETNQIEIF
jgi:hypothetical protein